MRPAPTSPQEPDRATREFYVRSLTVLDQTRIPYVVGGGYAMAHYTGIVRHTKDLDVFVREQDSEPALAALAAAGYRTERTFPTFLFKALEGQAFVDLLFNSGNGLCPVDEQWFAHAEPVEVWGYRAPFCPPEEILWSKAFVQDRERYDGADVAHLILARGQQFDWHRLLARFQGHERVLLSHLLLFGYVYPAERWQVPDWVMGDLREAIESEPVIAAQVCRGTLLSPTQYEPDVRDWGYHDARTPEPAPAAQHSTSNV